VDTAYEQEEAPQRERVCLISPGRRTEQFDDSCKEGIVAIGWNFLGDLSEYADVDAVRVAIQKHRGSGTNLFQDAPACHQFAHEMEVGDIVIAKRVADISSTTASSRPSTNMSPSAVTSPTCDRSSGKNEGNGWPGSEQW